MCISAKFPKHISSTIINVLVIVFFVPTISAKHNLCICHCLEHPFFILLSNTKYFFFWFYLGYFVTRCIYIRYVNNCIFSIVCRIRFNVGDAMKHDQCHCPIWRLIDKCCVVKWWFATPDSRSINICLNGI